MIEDAATTDDERVRDAVRDRLVLLVSASCCIMRDGAVRNGQCAAVIDATAVGVDNRASSSEGITTIRYCIIRDGAVRDADYAAVADATSRGAREAVVVDATASVARDGALGDGESTRIFDAYVFIVRDKTIAQGERAAIANATRSTTRDGALDEDKRTIIEESSITEVAVTNTRMTAPKSQTHDG